MSSPSVDNGTTGAPSVPTAIALPQRMEDINRKLKSLATSFRTLVVKHELQAESDEEGFMKHAVYVDAYESKWNVACDMVNYCLRFCPFLSVSFGWRTFYEHRFSCLTLTFLSFESHG